MNAVLTWRAALQNGCEPRLYGHSKEAVPAGESEARLDFKIRAKWPCTLSCYFTGITIGNKFQLSVYRKRSDEVYGLSNGEIDFKVCPCNAVYRIQVSINEQGRLIFQQATLIEQ